MGVPQLAGHSRLVAPKPKVSFMEYLVATWLRFKSNLTEAGKIKTLS